MTKGTPLVILGYLAICLIWGSTWLVIKVGMESLTVFYSAGFRFVLASILIYGIMKIKKMSLDLSPVATRIYLYAGFFSFLVPFGLVYWGEQYVNSGMASVLFAVYPFCVALVAHFRLSDEILNKTKLTGMIIGFGGIIVIFSDSLAIKFDLMETLGTAAILLSAIIQSFIVVMIKKDGKKLNPFSMNLVPMAISAIGFILLGIFFEDFSANKFDLAGVGSVVYLGVFGSIVAFTSYYWLLKRVSVLMMSLVAFITPILALVLGWVFYNESLTITHLLGSILVLAGLFISQFEIFFNKKTTN